VVVARGQVSFALGTDTGGSGRIPAGFNNIVGIKPSRGLISNRGVVPNCRSLDVVSVFALTCADGAVVFDILRGFDGLDPFSRPDEPAPPVPAGSFRYGILPAGDLDFFDDPESDALGGLYRDAIDRFRALGGTPAEIDFQPFREAGALMFDGPFVAERMAAIGAFLEERGDAVLPVTRGIIDTARRYGAADVFQAQYRLLELRRTVDALWREVDFLMAPTAARPLRIADLEREPVALNTVLGHYSYFANLLDLAALVVPNGFHPSGVSMGVTLLGPWGADLRLAARGADFHAALGIAPGVAGRRS
jgi:allophanate hydrolase